MQNENTEREQQGDKQQGNKQRKHFDIFNIRIEIPGLRSQKPTSRGRLLGMLFVYVTSATYALAVFGAFLALAFFAGRVYTRTQDSVDKPLIAIAADANELRMALTAQSKYLRELNDADVVAVAAGNRTVKLIESRLAEVEKLNLEAAALLGKQDAASLVKVQWLRAKVRALPSMAKTLVLSLLTETEVLIVLGFLSVAGVVMVFTLSEPIQYFAKLIGTPKKEKPAQVQPA